MAEMSSLVGLVHQWTYHFSELPVLMVGTRPNLGPGKYIG